MKGARIVVEIPTTDEEDVDRIFEAVAYAAVYARNFVKWKNDNG